MRVFQDRHDAGAQLALALHHYAEAADVVVLAHTRTSVPAAYEVATRLALPLDVLDMPPREFARGTRVGPAVSRDDQPPVALTLPVVTNQIVVLVDDGDDARCMPLAIEKLRAGGATTVIAAVGVASPQVYALLQAAADHIFCVLSPQHIYSVQAWFADYAEPSEADIRDLLVAAAQNLSRLRRGHFLDAPVDT
ncbi:MAG TPA: phosphoribosyltransferase family protein [Kofleriaceae bacterium]